MSKDVRSEVVKRLAMEYRATQDQNYLCQILKRVDPLLTHYVCQLKKRRKNLKDIRLSELYNCAVLGVFAAIQEVPFDEDPDLFHKRILQCVSRQVSVYYPRRVRREVLLEESADVVTWDTPVEDNKQDPADIIPFLSRLLKEGIISHEEFILLCRRVLDNVDYTTLGKEFNVTNMTMLRRLRRIYNKIAAYNASLRGKGDVGRIREECL